MCLGIQTEHAALLCGIRLQMDDSFTGFSGYQGAIQNTLICDAFYIEMNMFRSGATILHIVVFKPKSINLD